MIKIDISANNLPYWMVEQHIVSKMNDFYAGKLGRKNSSHSRRSENEETERLKERDQEVRNHEEAHKAAAGAHARGGPNYVFQVGQDGKQYAIGGSVQIDASKEDTPEKTIVKMQQVIAAAKAPAEPSAQDIRVAAQAAQTMQEAREELAEKRRAENEEKSAGTQKIEKAYKGALPTVTFAASA